jgi:hypothetical protein
MNVSEGRAYLKTVWFTENRIMAGRAERHIREGADGMHGALVILALRKLEEL